MIKFKSLSSGSCGNCYFLGTFDDCGKCTSGILIDAGVSPRRLKKELEREGLGMDDFQAILVTHDHLDHIRSLGSYCKYIRKPVWARRELHQALSRHPFSKDWIEGCRRIMPEGWTEIIPGKISAKWFSVPHDASDTVGYAIRLEGSLFVIMTDIGRMTEEALELASGADTVVIESNYDLEMLLGGPYPEELKERIRSGHGHLSNSECAEAIAKFTHQGLKHVFLCHLSEHNNTPETAFKASREALDPAISLIPLPRQTASQLFSLSL